MRIPTELAEQCIRIMLRPIVRFCLGNSHALQEYLAISKEVFVEIAEEELSKTTEKINVSRISVLSGVNRKDVKRIFRDKAPAAWRGPGMVSRVIGHWAENKHYQTKRGAPRVLTYQGEDNEFAALVEEVTTNINPGTVLFELERIGVVEKTSKGLKLINTREPLAKAPERAFELMAKDVHTLIDVVQENVSGEREIANMHVRTEYDNIVLSALPEIQEWLRAEGRAFHKRAREYLSQFDRDLTDEYSEDAEAGGRVVVTGFSWTDPKNYQELEESPDKRAAGEE